MMPNLKPPVTTTELALAYRERILRTLPADTQVWNLNLSEPCFFHSLGFGFPKRIIKECLSDFRIIEWLSS